MNINIDKLISKMEDHRKSLGEEFVKLKTDSKEEYIAWGRILESDFFIRELIALKNEQPEAITDDAHLRKHDDGRSAAAAGTSDIGQYGAASSETQADGQNEQTKEVCQCEIPNYDISMEWCFKCQRWTGL